MITERLRTKKFNNMRHIVTRGEFSAFVPTNCNPIGIFENDKGEDFTFLISGGGFFSERYISRLIAFMENKLNNVRGYKEDRNRRYYEFNQDPKYKFTFCLEHMKGGIELSEQRVVFKWADQETTFGNCFNLSKCLTINDMIYINECFAKHNNSRKLMM